MPRATILVTLLAALCLPGAAADAAGSKQSRSDQIEIHSFSWQACAPRIPDGLVRKRARLEADRGEPAGRSTPYRNFRFLVDLDGAEVRNLRLADRGCEDGGLGQLDGGGATIRCRGRSSAILTVTKPGVRDCTLTGRLDGDGIADLLTFAGPGGGPHGPRPDPGGPDQGALAAQALPNLKIRTAEAAAGDPTKLSARVVNVGPGPSGATRLKLFFHTPQGQVLTAHEQVPALSAGQQAVVTIGVGQPLAAAKAVHLRVDDPNVVPETNELDNGYIFKK